MPKLIENLKNKLMDEARLQVRTNGYSATTIRSVASACGVGVGTVYNYFSSKDELLAAYMLEDWTHCMAEICAVSSASDTPEAVERCIYDQLTLYVAQHKSVIRDKAATVRFAGAFIQYHHILRDQLAAPLSKFFSDAFTAPFIAQALLTWTMDGTDFDEIQRILAKLH